MDNKQLLAASITKWEAIVNEFKRGNKIKGRLWKLPSDFSTGFTVFDCHLCRRYKSFGSCGDCPLFVAGDGCVDVTESTWMKYSEQPSLETAQAMLDKLKELHDAIPDTGLRGQTFDTVIVDDPIRKLVGDDYLLIPRSSTTLVPEPTMEGSDEPVVPSDPDYE